jgi:hypothetical protein
MPDREWTAKELIEALKSFRQRQRSITRWGQTAQAQLVKRNTSRRGAGPTRWECYWTDRLNLSLPVLCFSSTASAAESLRSRCGSVRGVPVCSSQTSPIAARHVVQGTDKICSAVSSLVFTPTSCNFLIHENVHYCSFSRRTWLRTGFVWGRVSRWFLHNCELK